MFNVADCSTGDIMTHCFTHLLPSITASVIVCSKSKKLLIVICGLSAAYGDGGVIIVEWSDCVDA